MKRLTWLICGLILVHSAWADLHTYTTESVLKSGNIIKIRVNETGIYMIPYDSIAARSGGSPAAPASRCSRCCATQTADPAGA